MAFDVTVEVTAVDEAGKVTWTVDPDGPTDGSNGQLPSK